MLKESYSQAFRLQALYGALCVCWNTVALAQLQFGHQPIGPTASTLVILLAVVLVLLLNIALQKGWQLGYLCLSGLILVAAVAAVYSGLTKSADLWPTEFWRYAGVALNLLGVASFLTVIITFVKRN